MNEIIIIGFGKSTNSKITDKQKLGSQTTGNEKFAIGNFAVSEADPILIWLGKEKMKAIYTTLSFSPKLGEFVMQSPNESEIAFSLTNGKCKMIQLRLDEMSEDKSFKFTLHYSNCIT